MANTDNPNGASPASRVLRMTLYPKSTAAAIYKGDFVTIPAAGKVAAVTAGLAEVLGVSVGHALAGDTEILVYDDPDQTFYIQDDGTGGTLAAADVGLNADIVATAGNTTFLKSQMELDTSSKQTTTQQLRLLGKHPSDSWAKQVRCLVVINEHVYAKKTAGI